MVLLNKTNTIGQPYTQYSFNVTARTTSMTLTFSLRNNNAFWLLDNISFVEFNTTDPLIKNGDFEHGNLTYWNYCNPNATRNSSRLAQNGIFPSQSGQYFYLGAPYPYADFLSQTISTTIGRLYTFSFWLSCNASNSNNHFIATISF